MFALISYVLALALVGLVGAQNTSTTAFNPGTVDLPTRLAWCRAEISNCPMICGADGNKVNSCDENTLDFSCVCANGTTANVAPYMNTIPYYVCTATYDQCVAAHPNDLQGQTDCTNAAKCGTLNATLANSASSSSSSAAATTSSTPSSTSSSGASATSGSSTASASAKATGMATKLGQDYGMGVMAAVFAMAFKFLL